MKPKCLILGGLGFIGKNLFIALREAGFDTTIIANHVNEQDDFITANNVAKDKVIKGSILDFDFLVNHILGFDLVFSMAGISGAADSVKDPFYDLNTNLRGHLNILEACRKFNSKALLVFPSSRLVYGKPEYNPVDEKHPAKPESVYAIHKLTVEHYYQLYHRIHQLNSIVFRISNPYGPYQTYGSKHHGVLNLLIHNALKNKQIEVYGDGLQKRDFIYVDDLCSLFIKSMGNPLLYGKTFNVGYGKGISVLDAAILVAKFVPGTEVRLKPWPEIDKKIETGDYVSDITLIEGHTGWQPGIGFKEGIQKTIEFYSAHAG